MTEASIITAFAALLIINFRNTVVVKIILTLVSLYIFNVFWKTSDHPILETQYFFIIAQMISFVVVSLTFVASRKHENFLAFIPLLSVLAFGMFIYLIGFLNHHYEFMSMERLELTVERLVYYELVGVLFVSLGNGILRAVEHMVFMVLSPFIAGFDYVYRAVFSESGTKSNR